MKRFIAAVALGTLFLASIGARQAWAHASLVRCSVRNGATFTMRHAPHGITASFAEVLDPNPNQTWMAVFAGQGDHGLVTERTHSVVSYRNPKQMTLVLPKLNRGRYYLIWHTKSAVDRHIAAGIVYFRVK